VNEPLPTLTERALRVRAQDLDRREAELNTRTARLDQWAADVMSAAACRADLQELDVRAGALDTREEALRRDQARLLASWAALEVRQQEVAQAERYARFRLWLGGVCAVALSLMVGGLWFTEQSLLALLTLLSGGVLSLGLWLYGGRHADAVLGAVGAAVDVGGRAAGGA
jgi:hypothetical protein